MSTICYLAGASGDWGGASRVLFTNLETLDRASYSPIVLLPGPNSLFVLATAARRGVGVGYQAASGVWVGDAILMFLSAAGVASLLKAYPPIFLVIKYAGAAYLGSVGLTMLRGAWRRCGARRGLPGSSENVSSWPNLNSSTVG